MPPDIAARLARRLTELVIPLADKSRCYVMVPDDLTPEEGRRLLEVLSAWVPEEDPVVSRETVTCPHDRQGP